MARQHIPGLEVGVYSRGRILLTKGYGLANVELGVPVKPESIFQSGSIGKQFVSAAIMMLVEDGRLSLDESVTSYLTDAPVTWKAIKLKNLLSHTSGLADYEVEGSFTDPANPFYVRLDFSEDELLHKFYALKIEHAPGVTWAYCNANYAILGILIHRVTGHFYGDFLAQRIFRPTGMTHTRIISDRDIIPNRASGYELDDQGELKNQIWVSPTFNSTADGTLYFNVLDIAKWDAALYTTQLLKQSSLDRLWTVFLLSDERPNPAGYGFGWTIGTQQGHKRIQHTGAWQGFTGIIARYPDDGLSVAVLSNLDSGHANPGYLAHVIAGLADRPLLPDSLQAITDTAPSRTARLRAILTAIRTGGNFSDKLSPDMTALMKDGVIPAVKRRVEAVWPGGTMTLLKETEAPGSKKGGLYRISRGDQAILVRFALTDDGKISTLNFYPSRDYDD